MQIKKIIMLFLLLSPSAYADPAWLSPNMKISDCDGASWKTQGMCYTEYNRQHLQRIKQYLRDEISAIDSDSCDNDQLLQIFEDRENAWNEYSAQNCSLMNHCVGPCGSGHSSNVHSCFANMSHERLQFLENEVKNGMAIWGCRIQGSKKGKTLVTENYEVRLSGECELGLFSCDRVSYHGKNRNNRSEISLTGGVLMQLDEAEFIDMPVGYVFMNGDIEYLVTNSGVLRVTNSKQAEVLLEEQGIWQ